MPRPVGPAHPRHLDQQRGGGWRTQPLGVPFAVHGGAPAVLGLLGWWLDGTAARVWLWATVGLVALVVHELAHALVGRRVGASPTCEVTWSGGLTRWDATAVRTRTQHVTALLAGPAVGLALGVGALVLARAPVGWLVRDAAEVLAAVSLGAAVLDLLPLFPRDGARVALLWLRGTAVERTVQVATASSVVAAFATAGLALGPWPRVAVVPALFLVTSTWLALRGDRGIGLPVAEAAQRGAWTDVVHRVAADCAAPHEVAAAQQQALARSAFLAAADIGDAALRQGWATIGFARRTAEARALLEHDDLAMQRVHDAVAAGADPADLARGALARLAARADWPTAATCDVRP